MPGGSPCPPGRWTGVDRLGYGYEPGAEVLHEVSFRVPAGATVALVSPTGSGKSTLALLLAKLVPDQGGIRLGAATWPSWTAARWPRTAIAFQEPFLFSTSVADNIRLDRDGRDGVGEAARLAQADEFVTRLPDGYDTVVGERGRPCPAGSASGSPWPRPWPAGPGCWSWTTPPPASTP